MGGNVRSYWEELEDCGLFSALLRPCQEHKKPTPKCSLGITGGWVQTHYSPKPPRPPGLKLKEERWWVVMEKMQSQDAVTQGDPGIHAPGSPG